MPTLEFGVHVLALGLCLDCIIYCIKFGLLRVPLCLLRVRPLFGLLFGIRLHPFVDVAHLGLLRGCGTRCDGAPLGRGVHELS